VLEASVSGEVIVGGTLAILGRSVALGTPGMHGESAVLGTLVLLDVWSKNGIFKADGIVSEHGQLLAH